MCVRAFKANQMREVSQSGLENRQLRQEQFVCHRTHTLLKNVNVNAWATAEDRFHSRPCLPKQSFTLDAKLLATAFTAVQEVSQREIRN